MFRLGRNYLIGIDGVSKDSSKGLQLMRAAAELDGGVHDKPPVLLFYRGPALPARQLVLADALAGNGDFYIKKLKLGDTFLVPSEWCMTELALGTFAK